ncbi:hypothetical protein [Dietzia sp. UCD-THP]|uniref:hypothetical protein n=1 Tax=Dietzia sp. UCD-THP TaxID=1292020 RepID=UPI001EE67852|nr:hypothetical protein [Dietzia sp. UCD-THP]
MVDIGTPLPHAHGVQDSPPSIQCGQLVTDRLLTIRTDAPRALVRLRIEDPGENVAHHPLSLPFGESPLAGGRPRASA